MKLSATVKEAVADAKSKSRKKKPPKRTLALPDLEYAKTAVLNSLTSASGQRTYEQAIREFRRLVLLGAAPRLQPHRGGPLPVLRKNSTDESPIH